jgi:hypothetical protein
MYVAIVASVVLVGAQRARRMGGNDGRRDAFDADVVQDQSEAFRMFTYMLQRYTKKCHKILSMFTRFGEEIVLNLVAARPEWFDEPESRDFIVSFCVRNNLSLML